MTEKDRWVGQWQVHAVQLIGGQYLGPGTFHLKPVRDGLFGPIAFYKVTKISKEMPRNWQGLRFFPRGTVLSEKPSKQLPLWNQGSDKEWEATATSMRHKYPSPGGCIPGINPQLVRLEADIRPRGAAEALTLVRVEAAVEDGSDLLVILLKSKDYVVLEDGTGHGQGPPH
jgi:hypothetical protein